MNTVAMNVKTDFETKELIKSAAERLGLSLSSFIVMVAKQAALSPQIVINNNISIAQKIDNDLSNNTNISTFESEGEFFDHLDSIGHR
jgi:uncharacterized protein (DUF1778 family)